MPAQRGRLAFFLRLIIVSKILKNLSNRNRSRVAALAAERKNPILTPYKPQKELFTNL